MSTHPNRADDGIESGHAGRSRRQPAVEHSEPKFRQLEPDWRMAESGRRASTGRMTERHRYAVGLPCRSSGTKRSRSIGGMQSSMRLCSGKRRHASMLGWRLLRHHRRPPPRFFVAGSRRRGSFVGILGVRAPDYCITALALLPDSDTNHLTAIGSANDETADQGNASGDTFPDLLSGQDRAAGGDMS